MAFDHSGCPCQQERAFERSSPGVPSLKRTFKAKQSAVSSIKNDRSLHRLCHESYSHWPPSLYISIPPSPPMLNVGWRRKRNRRLFSLLGNQSTDLLDYGVQSHARITTANQRTLLLNSGQSSGLSEYRTNYASSVEIFLLTRKGLAALSSRTTQAT